MQLFLIFITLAVLLLQGSTAAAVPAALQVLQPCHHRSLPTNLTWPPIAPCLLSQQLRHTLPILEPIHGRQRTTSPQRSPNHVPKRQLPQQSQAHKQLLYQRCRRLRVQRLL
ncbi:hypothetical protein BDD12DRAFT_846768 [Trichophaea hybrida]|nr:hypothetical protein BDD12DRAFT_846768 [Trichophaea hybrida]